MLMASPLGRLGLLVLCVVCSALPSKAQDEEIQDDTEPLFREALAQYTAARYHSAALLFDQLIREHPQSIRLSAAAIMKGKSLFALGENLEASRTFKSFLSTFPTSRYVADAHYSLGRIYEGVSRFDEALEELLTAWVQSPEPAVPSLSEALVVALDSLIDRRIGLATIERSLRGATRASLRSYLWLKIAEKENEDENTSGVAWAVDSLQQRYPENPFVERVRVLKSQLAGTASIKLAVVLPLMRKGNLSAAKEIAADVYEGIEYAYELYQLDPSSRTKVTLETRDTERDPTTARNIVLELGSDPTVIGVIGPVFSATTSVAAVAAQSSGIPLISPTANSNGIAAAGRFVFQANPDYETRGRAMARYAVLVRGFRTVASIAPTDGYSRQMAEAFVQEAVRLGAKVIAQEWYPKGASDLKEQFSAIRKAGMTEQAVPMISFAGKMRPLDVMRLVEYGIPKKRIDSLMSRGAIIDAAELLGPNARERLDSLGLAPYFDLSRVDSIQYPVTGISAVYAPISAAAEIGIVSSQLVYFNFVTQLLGSEEWNDLPELHEHRRYCTGVIFETDSYVDTTTTSYRNFLSGFVARYKKGPSRNTFYGFDTAELVLALIRNGAATRSALTRTLSLMKDFQGLHSKIGFSSSRVNSWLPILQFGDDSIRRIDEIRVE
jgi:ABC-type branched-subunit amino acid transport system substrate-binding protein/TolA-binding protein